MEISNSSSNGKPAGFLIVGIGASAGGIQALKEFFQHVPGDSGIAYVVILHLSPDHDSQLARVLQAVTEMPVLQVLEKVAIQPDQVYVVPPNQHLVMEDGFISPSINLQLEDRRAPVDIFFRTLAENHGPRAVCVVLSGTGPNGSMGLKRVKEMGGVTYVQNPREAEFNEMPRNAIATELVDEVLPVAEIPSRIISYRNSIGSVQITLEAEKRPEKQQQALREIFTQLRIRTGHDFTNYKRATLLRRIERRINIRNLSSLPAYAALLQQNPEETNALLKDLLISVTNFFRDRKPYQTIEEEVIPTLIRNRDPKDQVRIWVAGCATGEEAYSLAMLLAERTLGVVEAPPVQIFATDIDEGAIAIARDGFYTSSDAADISPERLRRFFTEENEGYRIRREIREMILFANHNFLKDPPFSRLDLISCRNVLIYLNHTAQERVLETFHFALRSDGFLFLGSSESADSASDLYNVFSRENHIFKAREVANKHFPVPESVPAFLFPPNQAIQSPEKESRLQTRTSFGELHQKLLEEYAPPSVVVNEEYEIVHMSEKSGKYLEFSGGEPSQNLLKLVRPEIRLELRTALYQAVQKQTAVEAKNVIVNVEHQVRSINIHVRPVLNTNNGTRGLILVVFEPNEDVQNAPAIVISSDEPVAKQLEEELIRAKARLRHSNEEHEFQAEELKAANEELQAMNEEMRSAGEELETSKEELQSINEELRTVNQELKVKIEEISLTSNNLQNLINSADVGTIFLDRNFRTRLFTPAIREIFNLIPSDYGRAISDITHKLDYPNLLADAELVLQKLTIVEREVTSTDNRFYMMRILPYRTAEDRINGVVITFFDITKRKQAEQALRKSEEYLRLLIESATDYAILTLDTQRRVISWSTGAEAITGYTEQEIIGQSGDIIFPVEDRHTNEPVKEVEKAVSNNRAQNERWHIRKDGSRFWGSGSVSPLRDNDGTLLGFVKIMRDLTDTKEAEERYRVRMEQEVRERTAALKASREQYASLVENTPDVITRWDKNLRLLYANSAFEEKTGLPIATLFGKTNSEMGQSDEIALPYTDSLRKALETGTAVEHFNSLSTPGGVAHFYSRMVPEKNAEGYVESVLAIARDITDLKNSQNELVKAKENLELALKGAHAGIGWWNLKSGEAVWDENGRKLIGFASDEESRTVRGWLNRIHPDDRQKVIDVANACSQEAKDFNMHYRVVYDNGEIRHLLGTGHSRKNENGEPVESYGLIIDVTERRQAEQEILQLKDELAQRATDKYLTIFNSIDDGFCIIEMIFDENGRPVDFIYLETNPAFVKHATRPMAGKRIREVVPDYEQVWIDRFGHVAETGEPVQMEGIVRGLGDQWFQTSALRLGGPRSKEVAILFRNITERKKQEEKQQFLLQLSDSIRPLGTVKEITQVSGRILREHLHAGGVHYTEAIGTDELEVVHSDVMAGSSSGRGLRYRVSDFGSELAEAFDAGRTIWRDDVFRDDGFSSKEKEVYAALNVAAWATVPVVKNNRLAAALTVHFTEARKWSRHELTLIEETAERTWAAVEKAKAEEALRSTAARLQLALDAGKLGTYEYDFETGLYVSSAQHKANFGYAEEDPVTLESLKERVIPSDREYMEVSFDSALEKDAVYSTEYRTQLPAGDIRWIRSVGRFVYKPDGQPYKMVGITLDITEEKMFTAELSRQVTERTLQLQHSNNDLRQFAHVASHDLKEPVRKIQTFNNRVLDEYASALPPKARNYLEKIRNAANRMISMIEGVLQYSKFGNTEALSERVDLNEVIQSIETDLEVLIQEKGAVISNSGLPVLHASKILMYQLFYNLILNSLKFSKEGRPPRITLAAEQVSEGDQTMVKITLSDNGIGFRQEYEPMIFDTFTRLHSSEEYEGTGLGLALCKKIVERHHGSISAAGIEDEGAVFTILFPV